MEIFTLCVLLIAISIFDEAVNGQFQAARKLLQWFERQNAGVPSGRRSHRSL